MATSKAARHHGMMRHRLAQNPLEKAFADTWEKEAPKTLAHLVGDDYTDRDAKVAATIIQWLGTPVGQWFRRDVEDIAQKTEERPSHD